ncbi:MAG: recombination protein RecR [Gammaproteobacteria bacterium]|jgi:recombination protein RecR|nr:recombination protein RecR [Gammaproteobacteria bacterium]MBT6025055.1 recombination protein RecR [Gammaproteobacteria bacterium]MBT6558713.1 recombination protein RecR [Gammaproteobacteria bacterium]MDA7784493.1 recombination mediator RecR [Pseudomonadales bacterium]MDB2645806.1 recombination mediator RecR [Pseudomonadales bacterium]|tara:strand:- start:25 stop:624 length:600 start_codon:yes stop_codon:yes gene_type:complete
MSLIDDLVSALQVLPGVGPKSAQRMALHLLQRNRQGGTHLGQILETAMEAVRQCTLCRNLTEGEICRLCSDERRDNGLLCVVESPADVLAIEQAGGFRGYYFVLHGRLSPIDGMGPEQLGLQALQSRIAAIQPSEMILATNPTVEGEATAHYISRLVADQVPNISRIAHGVPLGGEIEYTDGGTLTHALQGRRNISLLD